MSKKTGYSTLYRYIDAHTDEFIEGLKDLLAKPSISTLGIGLNETAEYLKGVMEQVGVKTTVVATRGAPVVYGELITDPSAPTVLVYGHYDVQPPEPLEAWITPPFQPTIRDNKIYARGAGDNKGQLYAQLMGLKSLLATSLPLAVNVKFVFEGEEESGSPHLEEFIIDNKEKLKADFAYTSDGPVHASGRPVVQLGARGILYLELIAKGASRDLHSGNWGGPIVNPALRLIDLLMTMREPNSGKVLIEGFYDNIRNPTEEEKKILESLPLDREMVARDLGLSPSQIPSALEFYTKLMFQPTFNLCGFLSGYTGKGMKTIIPSTAVVKLDMRLVADQDPNDIFAKVQRHIKKYAPDVEVKRLGQMKPSKTPVENEYVRVVYDAVEQATGIKPLIYPSLGGSLPDYVFTGILGIPSIMVPYANIDESNHAPNENLSIPFFIRGIKCFATLLAMLSRK